MSLIQEGIRREEFSMEYKKYGRRIPRKNAA